MSTNNPVRLMPFKFSTKTCFVLEFGHQYIRFYSNRIQVGPGYEITSPYTAAANIDLNQTVVFQLQFTQIEDIIYITHPDFPVYSLTRVADTNWVLAQVQWLAADGTQAIPPMLDQNLSETSITPSGTTGSISLTASASIFAFNHVGSYWQLQQIRNSQITQTNPNTDGDLRTASIPILGPWTFQTSGNWSAQVWIDRSDDGGTTWRHIVSVVSNQTANFNIPGTAETEGLYSILVAGSTPVSGIAMLTLTSSDTLVHGLVKITGVSTGTSASADVVMPIFDTSPTVRWSEGAFSDLRGYPRVVCFHEQRLWFASTKHEPQRVWGSMTGDIENFDRTNTALATSSIAIDLAADKKGPIYWLASGLDLFAGLAGAEWTISPPNSSLALTTSNVQAKQQSENGSSEFVPALTIGDSLIYCERRGVTVSQIMFSIATSKYMSQELTVLANHILKPGVVQMDVQTQFDSQKIIWCVTTDGRLCGLTYDLDQKVIAWHQHNTRPGSGDKFISVASVYGPDGSDCDDVYVAVQRNINGTGTVFIELLSTLDWEEVDGDPKEAVYCDCAKPYVFLDIIDNQLSGLDAFNGEIMVAVASNMVLGRFVVSDGKITIPPITEVTGQAVLVGFDYTTEIIPVSMDTQPVVQSLTKNIKSVAPWMYKSLGGLLSNGNAAQDIPIVQRVNSDDLDAAPPLYTGMREISFPGVDALQPTLIVKQVDPLPLTVLSLNIHLDVTGRP